MPRVPLSLALCCVTAFLAFRRAAEAITLPGSETSYARYPQWNDCLNASFSFEFKSTQSDKGQVLLWYVDDGGTYDFFEVTMNSGRVRLVLNIVDGKDGNVEITVGHGVNDGRWHKVEVMRRRMETSLKVDGIVESRFSFGSDFYFGRGHNSYVYIGGLPSELTQKLAQLALPSALFHQRLKGTVRNILYGNCSCHTQRAVLIDGVGVTQFPPETCELRNPCREGCVCITTDAAEPKCDCSELQCVTGTVTHYKLPMDRLSGTTLVNPSGLDAMVFGAPPLTRGIQGNAIETDGRNRFIRVSGPGHRFECFGDLDKCPNGYTLSFWANFTVPVGDGDFVYLSNGGHSSRSHGVAMTYGSSSRLQFIFKRPSGDEWRASASNILPGRWHHIAASWSARQGLSLYINGDLVNTTSVASSGQAVAVNASGGGGANDFLIGKSNDVVAVGSGRRSMIVDEFNFWSIYKNVSDIRENGPFYRYYLPLNSRSDVDIGGKRFSAQGNPTMVSGKMGNALQFDGQRDYISGGDFGNSCLGDLTLCQYGLTAGMWIKFNDLRQNAHLLSTGKTGIELYYKDGRITAEVQQGSKNWKASWTKPETGRWYFLELTWNPDDGLEMLADLESVASATNYQRVDVEVVDGASNLFIGRANAERERYAPVTIDEFELWYGDRDRLIYFDFIQRGKPPKENFGMDAIAGGRVSHPKIRIDTFGLPRIAPGRIGGALNLDGSNEFASLGKQQEACLGNLDLCRHGLLLSAWLRPGQLKEGMDLMSSGSNGLRVWYEGGKLKVSARTSAKEWNLETDTVKSDQWQFVEFAWHPEDGLRFYVNEQQVAQSTMSNVRADPGASNPDREQFYFGRGDGSRSNARYGNFTLDDVEFWSSNREFLIAFDYIQRGKPRHILIDMDSVRGGRIEHDSLTIPVNGNPVNVPGKINNAIRLDGNAQYADVGDHGDSCLGNMKLCNHGITGSMFLNFRNFEENMYYLTSGGGLRLYYADDKLYASVDRAGQRWEVGIPNLRKDKWYFVEYTWHPEKGLQVYVDNRLAGDKKQPTSVPVKQFSGGHVLIGGANAGDSDDGGRFRYANALVDEVETWLGNRDNLIAFDYIIRDNVTHLVFPLEQARGTKVVHPDYSISLHNGATIGPGKVGNGALLGGTGEYLTFGDQYNSCMGNLEKCSHGMTVSFFLKPRQILNNAYYLSGGPYSVYSKDGKFFAKFSTSNKTWEISTDKITVDNWHKMELSWDEERGLEMYVNNERVASTKDFRTHPPLRITDHTVYLGRPTEDVSGGRYADAVVDELEYWFANRDLLKTLNLIGDEINHLIIDMDQIRGDILVHPKTVIYVSGHPQTQPGLIGNAVSLDGRNQFIDAGQDVVCGGNLVTCAKGFTLRFKMKPNQLNDNTYFVSSPPVDVYYQNNRLVAEVRTPTTVWRTSTPNLRRDAWHQVDVSWHPVDGLVLYVNSQQVDRQTVGLSYDGQYDDSTKHFYIGRANTDMIRERYANAVIDDLQIWEAKRDYLIPNLIDPDVDASLIRDQSTVRPTVTPTTRRPIIIPTAVPIGNKWLVFDGRSWILYDFSQLPDEYLRKNSYETFNIRFKTDSPDGLLWYTGRDDYHAHLTLKDGVLYLIANTTSDIARYQDVFRVQVPSGKLNDNKWHDVQIIKEEHEVKIIVDGNEFKKRFLSDVDLVNPNFVYLGGSNRTRDLTNIHISRNFEGIIDKAVLNGDTLPNELDLVNLYLIQPRPKYIFVDGQVIVREPEEPTAAPAPHPITFTTGQAYVRLPRWDATRSGSIEFHFKTFEPNGLILFNGGQPDSFSLELFDGQPYVNLDLGGGVYKYPFETRSGPVNDGQPHHIVVQRRGRHLRLTLDGDERVHAIVGGDDDLDLGSHLYIGAVDSPSQVPWHVWSRDRKFFRGCFWGLRINDGELVDLEGYLRNQVMPGIESGCRSTPPQCPSRPCVNGVCLERFDGFRCDCSATQFTGDRCQKVAAVAGFSGSEYVRINFNPTRVTHTNDISLQFKTPKENGLLFETSSRGTDNFLRVLLDKGQGKIETDLGGHKQLSFGCDQPLNDNKWHTLYIRRRANYLEAFIDNCTSESTSLPGSGYTLDIDEMLIARRGPDDPTKNSFIGHIRNFFFDDLEFIEMIGRERYPGIIIDSSTDTTANKTLLYVYPATFRHHQDSFVVLPALQIVGDTSIRMLVKTTDKDGLLLYNEGSSNNFFAVELVNGILHVSANDGSGPKVITSSAPNLADNRWHSIDIKQTDRQNFEVLVDNHYPMQLTFPASRNTLDLVDVLHVGGLPSSMWSRLPSVVSSRKGFSGCIASFFVNGQLYDLVNDGIGASSQYITGGCTDTTTFCTKDTCQHYGVCREGLNTFVCDCNMTSFVGPRCTAEAEGYRYGFGNRQGITVFSLTPPQTTNVDQLAFGFMTWHPNGTLVRIDSSTSNDYIDARLVNGNVVFTYDIGNGPKTVAETRRTFNDGEYHYVSFIRNGPNATLRVDDFPVQQHLTPGSSGTRTFDDIHLVKIGGNLDRQNEIIDYFNGIVSGVYLNGYRIIDLGVIDGDDRVKVRDDTIVASHPFFVGKPTTDGPVIPTDEPVKPGPDVVNGGGGGWDPIGEGDNIIVVPGNPDFQAVVAVPVGAGDAGEGARAAAVAGAMLGILAAASSIAWAFYKFKPGLIGAGGGGPGLTISKPVSSASYHPVSTQDTPLTHAKGGGATSGAASSTGAAATTGKKYGATSFMMTDMANGSAAAGGGSSGVAHMGTQTVGGGTTNFSEYFSFSSSSSAAAAGGAASTAVPGHKPGTTMRAIQTDLSYQAPGGAMGAGNSASSYTAVRDTTVTNIYNTQQMGGYSAADQGSSSGYAGQGYAGQRYGDAYGASTMSHEVNRTGFAGAGQQDYYGYSATDGQQGAGQMRTISPPPTDPNSLYQMRSMTLNYSAYNQQNILGLQQQQQQQLGGVAAVRPNLMAEEIRVDCVQMTNNGRYVVTGSIYGPPQVWDMKTGELVRIMQGDDFSSTDLHLANGDTLLVGQVAELEQADPSSNVHFRKLQLWDFNTGLPLEMRKNELCTASCLMGDGERMVLGRTEKYGGGTTIVIWDVLGNEPLRQIKYDGSVGFADQISYLNLSKDNRYVIAGFQNSFDQKANFISFDLTVNDFHAIPPQITVLDAQAEVTAVLENQEAVTGTRSGELIIWSMRTGKALRQLVSPSRDVFSQSAHQRQVMDLCVSKDGQFLVSASADATLKVWNLESEKLLRTLSGHKDEVWCCTVSNDNELIVSGSRDCTMRLWRLDDGVPVAAIDAGVDVFKVLLSNNKKTVVALADKYGARKLVMLQVVRTKVRSVANSRTGSRATSPFVSEDYNRY